MTFSWREFVYSQNCNMIACGYKNKIYKWHVGIKPRLIHSNFITETEKKLSGKETNKTPNKSGTNQHWVENYFSPHYARNHQRHLVVLYATLWFNSIKHFLCWTYHLAQHWLTLQIYRQPTYQQTQNLYTDLNADFVSFFATNQMVSSVCIFNVPFWKIHLSNVRTVTCYSKFIFS